MSIIQHDEALRDHDAMLEMRAMIAETGMPPIDPSGRHDYDKLIEGTKLVDDMETSRSEVAGLPGWWVVPARWRVEAYRGMASQIASRTGLQVFVIDYALAPEKPFLAAYDDTSKTYAELARTTGGKVAMVGDSAGGGVALSVAMKQRLHPLRS